MTRSPERKAGGHCRKRRIVGPLLLSLLALQAGFAVTMRPAWSLSEIKRNDTPPQPPRDDSVESKPLPPPSTVPIPDPVPATPQPDDQQSSPDEGEPDDSAPDQSVPDQSEPDEGEPDDGEPGASTPDQSGVARPEVDPDAPLPEVLYDFESLPEPVKHMRQLIIDATKSGNLEALRPLLGMGDSATQLSLGGIEGDPIQFLRELSGDKEGQEILAILEEVLSAGYVHMDIGKPNELYVWPYFFAIPLDKLDARQRVELFKIVTAGDYEDMKTYGAYIFYRVGITPDGKWSFFVAGD